MSLSSNISIASASSSLAPNFWNINSSLISTASQSSVPRNSSLSANTWNPSSTSVNNHAAGTSESSKWSISWVSQASTSIQGLVSGNFQASPTTHAVNSQTTGIVPSTNAGNLASNFNLYGALALVILNK
eukprot:NODE_188_length_13518_cov_0.721142.p10 type:complete len:130 gc:universal NODE_188_length_13518_cov_0.721142:8383-7994(-)